MPVRFWFDIGVDHDPALYREQIEAIVDELFEPARERGTIDVMNSLLGAGGSAVKSTNTVARRIAVTAGLLAIALCCSAGPSRAKDMNSQPEKNYTVQTYIDWVSK